MKTPKTILAVLNDNLCIMAKHCGIHPLIVAMDGFAIYFETSRKRRTAYLTVEAVIEWHENETQFRKLSERETENLRLLRAALDSFKKNGVQDGRIKLSPEILNKTCAPTCPSAGQS